MILIGPDEMRRDLRQLYEQDPEARLLRLIGRSLADPVKPQSKDGRFRPHPLLVLLTLFGVIMTGVFLYFSYLQP